jgi:hypothetical protein
MPFGLGFFATAGAGAAGSFDLLETQILGSSTSSVTFSSLSTYSATYKHLQIRYVAKSDRSSGDGNDAMIMTLNGDTGANYNSHILQGDGSAVNSGFETYQNAMEYTYIAGTGGNTTGAFACGVMDLLDAFSTSKFKTRRTLVNNSLGGSFKTVALSSALWRNTAAISSITFDQRYGSNFVTGSRFSLYGIKVN